MSDILIFTEIVTMSTLSTVSRDDKNGKPLPAKTKVHMKVDHGAGALGYMAYKKYFP